MSHKKVESEFIKYIERITELEDINQYEYNNEDIAERLCTPSELKKTRHGDRKPNSREEWLDVQARALYQASNRIKHAALNL
jgi:hypothetical protein